MHKYDDFVAMVIDFWHKSNADNADYVLVLPCDDKCFSSKLSFVFKTKLGSRHGVIVEGEQAKQLLNFYSLYAFTDKLIIGSLDLPHGRKLRNLLDSGIATEEELINDIIFGAM